MTRRGENIRKRKDGRWEARYIVAYSEEGNAKYRSVYGRSYKEVREKKTALLTVVADSHVDSGLTANFKLEDIMKSWLLKIKLEVKKSTYSQYQTIVSRHLIPDFGGTEMRKIDRNTINQFINQKLRSGKLHGEGGLSPKTVQDILSVLNCIIRFAVEQKTISCSPSGFPRIHVPRKEICILTQDEQVKLRRYLLHEINTYKLGILLSCFTGIRLGEICALRWSDISFETGLMKIRRTIQRMMLEDAAGEKKTQVIIDTPKSESSMRDIPLPPEFLSLLHSMKSKDTDSYVLTGARKYMEPRVCQNRFKKTLSLAGVRDVNFHMLRHTFATTCIEHGMDVRVLCEILGHSSAKITLDCYVHPSIEQKRRQLGQIFQASI